MSPVAEAIARHRAVQAVYDAAAAGYDAAPAEMAHDALMEVAEASCASDAEFIDKLKYLFAEETRLNDGIEFNIYCPSILLAVATHIEKSAK
jgi:hypothetical protein